eukprot:scaffold32770_cov37-Attheya_sp.AAC.3
MTTTTRHPSVGESTVCYQYQYQDRHSTAQHSTAQHSTAQHSTAPHNHSTIIREVARWLDWAGLGYEMMARQRKPYIIMNITGCRHQMKAI